MNAFEEERLKRVNDLRLERGIVLGHKFQLNIEDYISTKEIVDTLTDEIIQSQTRIQVLAESALSFDQVTHSETIRANFTSIRKLELNTFNEVTQHKKLSEIFGQIVGEFLALERELNSYDLQSAKLRTLRAKLAPTELEHFILASGAQVTILPNHPEGSDLPHELITFDQVQPLQDLANGIKVTRKA